ncbi:myb/SANT-like DNA-binding domain-containing protein 4 isoform X2 [Melanotaenia boesemani]|uniref:myb/SANT-like DNA-binding domain-containing protein 4 isoform X2 n=1 Tax=Melanotaenia boesemani TaxID=1250792 RepID=UPI001C04D424|nr:myb/SANT-like DNA-binding domain-containing protein 4 isoform X2 [Melanotaenia boesemani]XP_041851564.1 myb/SANT-like DNA-binding domain-containing protein 4 isoform X2 [Melanotaenia boesemani]
MLLRPPESHLIRKLKVKHLKRKRKSNYSVRETQTLIREIHKRKDVLFSRQQNTAVNELKRQAWEEVAQSVNALGEGELRTAAEVKRRYLDWRALTKKKQIKAELALSSSSSSMAMKMEYDQSSPEHEAASLESGCDQLLDLSGFPKDCQCDWPELAALSEPSSHSAMAHQSVKMEDDISEYRMDGDAGDGEVDEDDIPSILSEIESRGEGHAGDIYPHNDLGMLSSSKDPTSTTNRDLLLAGGLMGIPAHGLGGFSDHENVGAGFLVAVEKQRLELEKQRLAVETERLAVEKERLAVEKERLHQMEVERERLHLERERLQVERERLRILLVSQQEHADSSFNLPPQQGPPSSSTSLPSNHNGQGEKRGRSWMPLVDLETEKMNLEKERLQLEKERLQFFKFEAGRLQIERERLQVEKERMQLHKDHHSVKA